MRSFSFRVLACLVPAIALLAAPGCGGRQPDVLLVTVSGLRADGVDPGKTPHLAGLPGRVSPDVVVPVPDTAVALEALVTGQGLDGLGNRYGDLFRVPPDHRVLAERLAERGYRTVAFVGDGALSEMTGLARGFSEYHSPSGIGDTPVLTDETGRLKPHGTGLYPAEEVRDAVGAWLADHAQEGPFFLWVHVGDLSAAVLDPEDPRAAWNEALARVDGAIGDVIGALRTYGVEERTLVAVVSLHGEALGAHGETGHGIFLSDEVIRVPAWLAAPGGRPAEEGTRPLDLGGLGRSLARAAGLDPGKEGAGPPRSATWWPSRLYGWPDDAPPADAADVLRLMGTARRLTLEGKDGEAREVLRRTTSGLPRGLAPRLLLARNLAKALRETKDVSRQKVLRAEMDRVLEECRALARDDVARSFDLARVLVGVGKKDEALRVAGDLEEEVLRAGERLALAQLYAEAGASERAAEIVGELVQAEPSEAPELCTWQGDLLRRAGNVYQARKAYEKAVATPRGRTPEVLAKLGDCLAGLGEKDVALRRYAEAVRLDPSYRYPHLRAAEILLEEGKTGEAATAIAMSVPDTGDVVQVAVERARRMLERELYGPAAEELRRALEKEPESGKLRCWLARVYAETGDRERARKILAEVLEVHPDNPLAWEERARLAVLAGDEEEALRCLRRAETYASPVLVDRVRRDPVFRQGGVDSPLGKFAAAFGEGRRPRSKAAPLAGKGK